MFTVDKSTPPSLVVEGLWGFVEVKGVGSWYMEDSFVRYHGQHCAPAEEPATLLVLETIYDDAFAHWVFESAVLLPLVPKLQEALPGLRLLLRRPRRYKSLFLEALSMESLVSYDFAQGDTLVFPVPGYCLNDQTSDEKSREACRRLGPHLEAILTSPPPEPGLLVMPRQSAENYWNAPRDKCDFALTMARLQERDRAFRVLHTDEVKSLREQWEAVRAHRLVAINDGSAVLVAACVLARDTGFLVCGHLCTQMQSGQYPKMRFLMQLIAERGNRLWYFDREETLVQYLTAEAAQPA